MKRTFDSLSDRHQGLLSTYLAARMALHVGLQERAVYLGFLDAVWEHYRTRKKVQWLPWIEKLEEALDQIERQKEQEQTLDLYLATQTGTALIALAYAHQDKNSDAFYDLLTLSLGQVSFYLEQDWTQALAVKLGRADEEVFQQQVQQAVKQDELYQYEQAIQQAMLDYLQEVRQIDAAVVAQVQEIMKEEGHSNLGW